MPVHLQPVGKRVEAGLPAHEVDSPSVHEREDPGRRPSARGVELRRLPPHGEERFLHRVLRQGGVAQDTHRETVRHRPEPVVQRSERLLVTLCARGEQNVIVVG